MSVLQKLKVYLNLIRLRQSKKLMFAMDDVLNKISVSIKNDNFAKTNRLIRNYFYFNKLFDIIYGKQ